MKKLVLPSELVYLLANFLLAFAVSMLTTANFGVSMIVAPPYILSLRFPEFLTLGLSEYIVQFVLFLIFCLILKRIKLTYFWTIVTILLYGVMVDFCQWIFAPASAYLAEAGNAALWLRILLFIGGELLTAFSIVLHFRTYLPAMMYDFFLKVVQKHSPLELRTFKHLYDLIFLAVGLLLSLVLFGGIRGLGWGTVLITLVNGTLIAFFDKVLDKSFAAKPLFPKIAEKFEKDIA